MCERVRGSRLTHAHPLHISGTPLLALSDDRVVPLLGGMQEGRAPSRGGGCGSSIVSTGSLTRSPGAAVTTEGLLRPSPCVCNYCAGSSCRPGTRTCDPFTMKGANGNGTFSV